MNTSDKRQFYFSLFRVITMFRGGDARRTENNAFEAWLIGFMIYSIHYLFFAILFIPSNLKPWLTALLLIALAFWIWLFSKHLVGNFYDGHGLRIIEEQPSASRTRRHLVGGGRDEPGGRDGFGF